MPGIPSGKNHRWTARNGAKKKAPHRQFIVELANVRRNLAPSQGQMKITEPQVEQFLVRPISSFRKPGLRRLDVVVQ
jgi:hypothetical protein